MTNNNKVKLSKKKNGSGYLTSYSVNIGCAEAREVGFLDENGEPFPLVKIVDTENGTILFKRAE